MLALPNRGGGGGARHLKPYFVLEPFRARLRRCRSSRVLTPYNASAVRLRGRDRGQTVRRTATIAAAPLYPYARQVSSIVTRNGRQ